MQATVHGIPCMAAGRRISSYGTYQEDYVDHSWAVKDGAGGGGEEACIPQDYGDTAVVPAAVEGEEQLYTDRYCDNEMKKQVESCDESPLSYPGPSSQLCGPTPVDPAPGDPTHNNVLYVLEDRVRHMVNVSIEEFRADVQHIFYQEFGHCRQSMIAQQEEVARNIMCDDVEQSRDIVCTSQSSASVDTSEECEGTAINECMIKLLTCAAVITSTLQRQEYAAT